MITRKALVAKLKSMNLDTVLFDGNRRTANHPGYAVEQALSQFFPNTTFGQTNYAEGMGAMKPTPKWFRQMYAYLAWCTGDICAGTVLQALA